MKKAGIAIDGWKLPIFERHLAQAGYAFEQGPGPVPDTLLLLVQTESLEALALVVRAANAAAEKGPYENS